MLQLLAASILLLVPMGPVRPHDQLRIRALRRAATPGCCASNAAEQAQAGFFRKQKAAKGVEAFSNTLWSVLMNVKDSGNVLFTVHLLDDFRCRFSDGDKYGEWQCEEDYVVVEKPKGLYNETLYLSALHPSPIPAARCRALSYRCLVAGAKLQLPTEEQPRTRLVDGLVQRSFPIEGTQGEVELRGAGSFRAHEQIDIPDGED